MSSAARACSCSSCVSSTYTSTRCDSRPQLIHRSKQSTRLFSCVMACLQGAQLMSKFGINVPDGVPVFQLDQVLPAAKRMADDKNEVGGV